MKKSRITTDLADPEIIHIRKVLKELNLELCIANTLKSYRENLYVHFSSIKRINPSFWTFLYFQIAEKYALSVYKLCDTSPDSDNIKILSLVTKLIKYQPNLKKLTDKDRVAAIRIKKARKDYQLLKIELENLNSSNEFDHLKQFRDKYIAHLTNTSIETDFKYNFHTINQILNKLIEIHKKLNTLTFNKEDTYEIVRLDDRNVEKTITFMGDLLSEYDLSVNISPKLKEMIRDVNAYRFEIKIKPKWLKIIPILYNSAQAIYPYIYISEELNQKYEQGDKYAEAIVRHEQIHLERIEKLGKISWYKKYIFSQRFRLQEELEAYKVQFDVMNMYDIPIDIDKYAKILSSWIYLKMIDYKTAIIRIREIA